jgi:hypothetical protein
MARIVFSKRSNTLLCLGFSRKLENHSHSVALFTVARNFFKVHSTLGCTPALDARLTDVIFREKESDSVHGVQDLVSIDRFPSFSAPSVVTGIRAVTVVP